MLCPFPHWIVHLAFSWQLLTHNAAPKVSLVSLATVEYIWRIVRLFNHDWLSVCQMSMGHSFYLRNCWVRRIPLPKKWPGDKMWRKEREKVRLQAEDLVEHCKRGSKKSLMMLLYWLDCTIVIHSKSIHGDRCGRNAFGNRAARGIIRNIPPTDFQST